MNDETLRDKLARVLELLESSYTTMMLEMGLRLMPQNGDEILYMRNGEQRINVQAMNDTGVSEVVVKHAMKHNPVKSSVCKYYDCGWCYAPDGVKNNSTASACMKPKDCVQNGGQSHEC